MRRRGENVEDRQWQSGEGMGRRGERRGGKKGGRRRKRHRLGLRWEKEGEDATEGKLKDTDKEGDVFSDHIIAAPAVTNALPSSVLIFTSKLPVAACPLVTRILVTCPRFIGEDQRGSDRLPVCIYRPDGKGK